MYSRLTILLDVQGNVANDYKPALRKLWDSLFLLFG